MRNPALFDFLKTDHVMAGRSAGALVRPGRLCALLFLSTLLFPMSTTLYAEEGQPPLSNIKLESPHLRAIDPSKSPQDNQKIFRRNRRYLRNALKSYSTQTLRSLGLSDRTIGLMGATFRFATEGAKLNLNESKTLTIHFNEPATPDRMLYLGYSLDW
jgi:hypothetical protein